MHFNMVQVYKNNNLKLNKSTNRGMYLVESDRLSSNFDNSYISLPSEDKNSFVNRQIKVSHIGTDEIGINDYFGPICVVSCYIDKKDFDWLKQFDFSNVKSLTQSEIITIAKAIKDRVIYSLLILDNPHYNKMVADGLNPASIKAKLYNQAITNVMQKIKRPIQKKVIEQFVSPKTYYNYLKKEVIVVKNLDFDVNAHDKYLAVSCAHILSRYASIQYFNNMSSRLKIKLPRGTNILVDKVGAQLIEAYGDAVLNKVAKKHFANTRKILALKNNKE